MISFRTDFDRYYNEIKLRNVYDDREILIDSTVSKDFVWSKAYQLSWNLTRSLNFDISISDQARIERHRVLTTGSEEATMRTGRGPYGAA